MILSFLIFLYFLIISNSKYIVSTDITDQQYSNIWYNDIENKPIPICQNVFNQKFVGTSQSTSIIKWKMQQTIQQSIKIYGYLEYKISGNWNDDEFEIYANNLKVYSQKITFNDVNKDCNQMFLYKSYAYFFISDLQSEIKLEIIVNQSNVGLYIYNLILLYQIQIGRNELITYSDQIKTCPIVGMKYVQYYCQCDNKLVFENQKCVPQCDQNYIYNQDDNYCYYKQHCTQCNGINRQLICDTGYYTYEIEDIKISECIKECPNTHYQNEITKQCLKFSSYLSVNFNGRYNVNHLAFFINLSEFMNFLDNNDIIISIDSTPSKIVEQKFFYKQNKFYIGTFDTFQSQTIQLTINIQNSQHKLIVKAIGHFIDFYPKKITVFLNGIQQTDIIIKLADTNQILQDKLDYITYFEFIWTRNNEYPLIYNTIIFQVEQEIQNGKYIGYFYLEDVQLYSFECEPECKGCFIYQHCQPCLYPENKNLENCQCLTGYIMLVNKCIKCPSYCTTCLLENSCYECQIKTLRTNPPLCNICPDYYYIEQNKDNCQPCQIGCKICISNNECINCQSGYYRSLNNQCILHCNDGQFIDITDINDPKCSICDISCLKCEKQATQCIACKDNSTLYNNQCYSCQEGYYIDGLECNSCILNCKNCISNICTQCIEPYFYKSTTNECLLECQYGYYIDYNNNYCNKCHISCMTCLFSTEKDCLSCPYGKLLNKYDSIIGECSSNCLIGFYKQDNYCAKCWKGCQSCIDSSQACLICEKSYFRLQFNGYCYENCPDGYYNNLINKNCLSCQQICKTCYGYSDKHCLSCNQPLVYYEFQCLEICPDGYGNINNICKQCASNCKSCFGQLFNQCLSCEQGFYFMNNQCYNKCPTSFIGIRPQYICKCKFENCIICNKDQYFLNNKCYNICPDGYYGYNQLCIKCFITCKTCFGEEQNQCLKCQAGLILSQTNCIPECLQSTYHNIDLNECLQCNEQCLACNGPNSNQCTACQDGLLLTQQNECKESCPNQQFAVFSEQMCYNCHSTCLTCFGRTYQNCLNCSNHFYLFECVDQCPDGFKSIIQQSIQYCEPNFTIILNKCSYQCETCQLTERYCTKCSSNRAPNPPNCNCEIGYYDDGMNSKCLKCSNKCYHCRANENNCITCKGDRILPHCDCPQYYYDDQESVYCIKCQDNCQTCNETQCLQCLADRINSPFCVCGDGYYEAFTYYCQECSIQCKTCFATNRTCSSCIGIRQNPPFCGCPYQYFENPDGICEQCNLTCIECNEFGCLSCFGNRIGPNYGQCICDELGIDRQQINSYYCTDCQLGVPYFILNDDFTGFSFDFGAQISIPENISIDLCIAFFDKSTLELLGDDPKCYSNFTIIFGQKNAKIEVGNIIKLNNIFKLRGCNSEFIKILDMPLQISNSVDIESKKPKIKFSEISKINICNEAKVWFDQQYFNGYQDLKIISWDLIFPKDDNQIVEQILKEATENKQNYLIFPSKIFYSLQKYKISVTVESFAKLQNILSFQFTTFIKSQITFETLNKKTQYHRYEKIEILNSLTYSNCFEEDNLIQMLYYEITLVNKNLQILNNTITNNINDGFQIMIPLEFKEYYFNFDNPYLFIINLKLQRLDYNLTQKSKIQIFIIPTIPILTILGGNKMIGFTEKIYLNTSIKDLDLSYEEALNKYYFCYWSCRDIVNGTQCININQQIIQFDNQCNQTIPAKSFIPYSVFIFEFSIFKENVYYSTNISIQIIEIDLPYLTIEAMDQQKEYNYYDEFIYKLIYPGINPDILMYAGAVIYDFTVQSSFQFYYLEVKFKLQNYFTELDEAHGNYIKLRLSVYDPRYIMPSISTQLLRMNIPPQNCYLEITKPDAFVEFIDLIKVQILDCYDDQMLYSVQLYQNESIYNSDLLSSKFHNFILLIPQQKQNSLNFTLPYMSKKECLLVFNIQDQNFGITNLTYSLKVLRYRNLTEINLVEYENSLKSFDQQLIGYSIITQKILSMNTSKEYRLRLFYKLVNIDIKQQLLVNQTDTLYKSISNLLILDSSLLNTTESLLYQNLQYRITQANLQIYQIFSEQKINKISSLQNQEKTQLIKLYYTFMSILSSCIRYKVSQNVTSNQYQILLQVIQGALQNVSVANEPIYSISQNSIYQDIGFVTTRVVQELTGTMQIQQARNLGEQNSTNFFAYSMTRYKDNPFYVDGSFPKNSSGYEAIDPKIQIQNSDEDVVMGQNMKLRFHTEKNLSNNTIFQCIVKFEGEWNADICKSKTKNGQTICECQSLNTTSIMEQLEFIADRASEVFSTDTFLAFGTFPFYKASIFYIYIIITLIYIYVVYWGMKVDKVFYEKLHLEQELKKKLEQEQKEQKEKLEKEEKEKKDREEQELQESQNVQDIQKQKYIIDVDDDNEEVKDEVENESEQNEQLNIENVQIEIKEGKNEQVEEGIEKNVIVENINEEIGNEHEYENQNENENKNKNENEYEKINKNENQNVNVNDNCNNSEIQNQDKKLNQQTVVNQEVIENEQIEILQNVEKQKETIAQVEQQILLEQLNKQQQVSEEKNLQEESVSIQQKQYEYKQQQEQVPAVELPLIQYKLEIQNEYQGDQIQQNNEQQQQKDKSFQEQIQSYEFQDCEENSQKFVKHSIICETINNQQIKEVKQIQLIDFDEESLLYKNKQNNQTNVENLQEQNQFDQFFQGFEQFSIKSFAKSNLDIQINNQIIDQEQNDNITNIKNDILQEQNLSENQEKTNFQQEVTEQKNQKPQCLIKIENKNLRIHSNTQSPSIQIQRLDEYPEYDDEVLQQDKGNIFSKNSDISNYPSYQRILIVSPSQEIEIQNQIQNVDIQKNDDECIFTILNTEKQLKENEKDQYSSIQINQIKGDERKVKKIVKEEQYQMKNKKQKLQAFIQYVKYFHQVLSIIYKSDEKYPRALRASIIYTSIIGSFSVLFIFNQPENLSFTIALALITAPVNKIYQIILEKLLSHLSKTVRIVGTILMIIITALLSYIMLAGLIILNSVDTANTWSYIFIGTFSLDNLLYSPLQIFLQFLIQMEFFKIPIIKLLLTKLNDEQSQEFIKQLMLSFKQEE